MKTGRRSRGDRASRRADARYIVRRAYRQSHQAAPAGESGRRPGLADQPPFFASQASIAGSRSLRTICRYWMFAITVSAARREPLAMCASA
ncbi:hypothetical protein KOBOMA_09365 [Rhodanobacter sp. Root179]